MLDCSSHTKKFCPMHATKQLNQHIPIPHHTVQQYTTPQHTCIKLHRPITQYTFAYYTMILHILHIVYTYCTASPSITRYFLILLFLTTHQIHTMHCTCPYRASLSDTTLHVLILSRTTAHIQTAPHITLQLPKLQQCLNVSN